jgi:putative cell wall-binding protein
MYLQYSAQLTALTPKKHQYKLCTAFANAQMKKKALTLHYETHQLEKQLSSLESNQDKVKAKTTKTMKATAFGLQSVLLYRGETGGGLLSVEIWFV